jgi:hypothetical protein
MLGDLDGMVTTPGCMAGAKDILILGFDLAKRPLSLRCPKLVFESSCRSPGVRRAPHSAEESVGSALDRNGTVGKHYLEYDTQQMKFIRPRHHRRYRDRLCTDRGKKQSRRAGDQQYGLALCDPNAMRRTASSRAPSARTSCSRRARSHRAAEHGDFTRGDTQQHRALLSQFRPTASLFHAVSARQPGVGSAPARSDERATIADHPITGPRRRRDRSCLGRQPLHSEQGYSPQSLVTEVYKIA